MPVAVSLGSRFAPLSTWEMAGQRGRWMFGMGCDFSHCHVDVIDVIANRGGCKREKRVLSLCQRI
jgi:hypothetical protein